MYIEKNRNWSSFKHSFQCFKFCVILMHSNVSRLFLIQHPGICSSEDCMAFVTLVCKKVEMLIQAFYIRISFSVYSSGLITS